MHAIDPAATAWLLASTALVLLMTPGLAIFYGGMVRTTGVLNMMMMSFISIPLVTVAWLLVGYTTRSPKMEQAASSATSDMSGCSASAPIPPMARFPNCYMPRSS
jgi:ammonia channel protein AmtB